MLSSIARNPQCAHETPRLRRWGVSRAFAESDPLTVRELHVRTEMGSSHGHDGATFALKGPYSNRPPDKAVVAM